MPFASEYWLEKIYGALSGGTGGSGTLPPNAAQEDTLSQVAASASVLDDWDESDRAKVNSIVGQAGVEGGSGASSAKTQRVAIATDANVVSVDVASGAGAGIGAPADAIVAAGAAGSLSAKLRRATQGLEDLKTLIVLAAGSATIGKVGVDQTTPGTTDSVSVATGQGAGATIGATADAIVAAGAAGSLSAKLRRVTQGLEDLKSLVVLAAGSAIIGKVGIDQTTPGTTNLVAVTNAGGYSAALTITRPANQTPYTAGDVVGGALTFPTMGPNGGRTIITTAQLEADIASIPSGMTSFILYLYNVTPPSALADNAVFDLPSGDRASFLGSIALGSLADLGSTLYVETNNINKQLKQSGTSLFGYLVTVGGFTPAANSEVYVATLHAVAV